MKYKYLLLLLFGLVVLLTALSCKTTPQAADATAQGEARPAVEPAAGESRPAVEPVIPALTGDAAPPGQAELASLAREEDRARAARKLASDFEAPSLFPSDWESADSLFAQAEQQKDTSSRGAARESEARYAAAADAFEELAERSLALAYDYAEREILAAREAAIEAGASDLLPDFLLDADNTAISADDKYLAKDYYGASDEAEKAFSMYTTLKTGLDAYKLREMISERNFESYGPSELASGDSALQDAADAYEAGDYGKARDKAEEALFNYNTLLKTAWETYVDGIRSSAAAERQKALDAKANVAVRMEFNSAEAIFNRANNALRVLEYGEASLLYEECRPLFIACTQMALEKQEAANDALRRADQRVAESEETARNAEAILEGGLE